MKSSRIKNRIFPLAPRSVLALFVISGFLFGVPALGQRAEREAEQQVSFSAETIIGLLRTEPGLFLQIKRLLVQKAYEQGRILDPGDLTDDAVFRLLRADNALRILATHEIEIRSYIRPKPTQQELERDRSLSASGQPATVPKRGEKNQESIYWSRLESASPLTTAPSSSAGSAPAEQNRDELLPRRLPPVDRTQADPQQDNPFEIPDGKSDGKNNSEMSSVRPEELPALLSASAIAQPRRSRLPAQLAVTKYSLSADRSNLYDVQVGTRHGPNPYASVPSLYDLYTQVSPEQPVLERFAAEVFRNGAGKSDDLPMDLPVGPDYVLGPGDGLSINLWGSVDQRLRKWARCW